VPPVTRIEAASFNIANAAPPLPSTAPCAPLTFRSVSPLNTKHEYAQLVNVLSSTVAIAAPANSATRCWPVNLSPEMRVAPVNVNSDAAVPPLNVA
jgi:hypothetical protein